MRGHVWAPWPAGRPGAAHPQHGACSGGGTTPARAGPRRASPSRGQTNLCFPPPQYKAATLLSAQTGQDLREEHPWVDYTSPSLITLLFTDLGVLTPSAVSDELIKLYL